MVVNKAPKILAVITARLNSTAISRKPLQLLAGKPLIAHTIEAALGSSLLTRTIVTTESEEIAEVSRSYGAEIPFMRPSLLSSDSAQVCEVIDHALQQLRHQEGYVPDIVVFLQPASPLCLPSDIDGAIDLYTQKDADLVVSITVTDIHPYWATAMDDSGRLSSFMPLPPMVFQVGRQSFPPAYQDAGAVYVTKPDHVMRMTTERYTEKTFGYEIPIERSMDIHTPADLVVAESFLRQREHIHSVENNGNSRTI